MSTAWLASFLGDPDPERLTSLQGGQVLIEYFGRTQPHDLPANKRASSFAVVDPHWRQTDGPSDVPLLEAPQGIYDLPYL